jgi:macrolide-specific efflux system membrane fusion protein
MKVMLFTKIKNFLVKIFTSKLKWLVLVIMLAAGAGWWFWGRNEKVATPAQTVVAVARQTLQESIEVTGVVSAANYTLVQTQAIGTVKTVYVNEGQVVKSGDKLFELELTPEGKEANQAAYSSYLSAQNNLKNAENQLNSLQVTLFEKNQYFIDHAVAENLDPGTPEYIMQNASWLAAENSYKNQQAVITQSRANLTSAYQNYQNTSAVVTAPVAGIVENITAVVGLAFGQVSSGTGTSLSDRMATIKTGDQALVIFDLSASDISKVELGQRVVLNSSNLATTYEGTVVSVDRYGTTGNVTTYQVIAQIEETQETDLTALLPNLSVDGEILVSERPDVLVVPALAISSAGERSMVQIQTADGGSEMREVTTGITSGNLTEITAGVSEGEQVVFSLPEYSSGNSLGTNMMFMGPGMGGGGGARQMPAGGGNMSRPQ